MPPVSIVICSIDPAKFQRVCDNYRRLYAGQPVEIIGIHDARSLAEGYNRGVAKATGELLILSHDDIEILNEDFAARVAGHLASMDLIGVAGTTRLVEGSWIGAGDPYVYTLISFPSPEGAGFGTMLLGGGPLVVTGIQALDGVFMAMQRKVATAISFDAVVFDDFHLYDLDFSFRAYQAGFKLGVCRDLVIIHESDGRHDAIWEKHKRRFEAKYHEHLPRGWSAKQGANAAFSATTREDIVRKCAPAQLVRIAEQIGRANTNL
jgi:GT2 family glycosyltransferase